MSINPAHHSMILVAAGVIRVLGLDPIQTPAGLVGPIPPLCQEPLRTDRLRAVVPVLAEAQHAASPDRSANSISSTLCDFRRWRRMRKRWLSWRSIPTLQRPSVLPTPLMAERPVVLPPSNQGECRGSDLSRRYCQTDRTSLGAPMSRCSLAGDSTRIISTTGFARPARDTGR